ncbi:MAG: hypothetical protein J1E81_07560 [Eubacterium sp.]|nr:hypothetical protein [Eubacterium sp.]
MRINLIKKRKEKKEALHQAKRQAKAERHKDDAKKLSYQKQIANLYYDLVAQECEKGQKNNYSEQHSE